MPAFLAPAVLAPMGVLSYCFTLYTPGYVYKYLTLTSLPVNQLGFSKLSRRRQINAPPAQ